MVFIPLKDRNPRSWIRGHYVTLGLLTLSCLAFTWQLAAGAANEAWLIPLGGVTPSYFLTAITRVGDPVFFHALLTLISYQFLHAGWMHIVGNMLFLWVFGDNVEDALGHWRFLGFYLLCGALAAIAQVIASPGMDGPIIGASGAVAGVLGAYLMLYPRVRVLVLVLFTIPVRPPSYILLGIWIGVQMLEAFWSDDSVNTVAWWAHIGGFAMGAALICLIKLPHVRLFDPSRDGILPVGGLRLRSQLDKDNTA